MNRKIVLFLSTAFLLISCSTFPTKKWDDRVGHFSYSQAVQMYGSPNVKETLPDNSLVATWISTGTLTSPSYTTITSAGPNCATATTHGGDAQSWTEKLVLTFDKDDVLSNWSHIRY